MTSNHKSSSHRKLIVVVACAAVVVVLALLSAFVWPGWALNKNVQPVAPEQSASAPTTPSIKAKELPKGSTELLKSMPDSVLNFARVEVSPSDGWKASTPLEEYAMTYSTGKKADDVEVRVAQWPSDDKAKKQYETLSKGLSGVDVASGDVKVSGNVTGAYVVKETSGKNDGAASSDASGAGDEKKDGSADAKVKSHSGATTAVWRNDTVVFEATGSKDSVLRFYQKFPL